mgnify:CR=1 FL=1
MVAAEDSPPLSREPTFAGENPCGEGTYEAIFGSLREAPADRPFVVGQLGQSLDGRIATRTGDSRYVNGACALDHLHRLRAAVDAVLVGAGTIAADDPQLNVRRTPGRNPARVALDPSGRTGAQVRWLADDGARRILVLSSLLPSASAALPPVPLGNVSAVYDLVRHPTERSAAIAWGMLASAMPANDYRVRIPGVGRTLLGRAAAPFAGGFPPAAGD